MNLNKLLNENKAHVFLNFGSTKFSIGSLLYANRGIFFEFHPEFLNQPFDISPIHLAKKSGVFSFSNPDLLLLPGVFHDALPDGWGILLQDRFLKKHGSSIHEINPVQRLLLRGKETIGALEFVPEYLYEDNKKYLSIEELYLETEHVVKGDSSDFIQELLLLNGSSAGARPKIIAQFDTQTNLWSVNSQIKYPTSEDWIIKFPNSLDGKDSGAIEYVYSQMAHHCGINMPATQLIESKHHQGFFAVKRFDKDQNKRLHVHSISGLLHHNFRIPSLDYEQLFQTVLKVSNSYEQTEQLFRQLVFNVIFHNRDDHGKNFSMIMNEFGQWRLSPAYDLTFSYGPNGEHSTTILGEGRNPERKQITKLGKSFGLRLQKMNEIIEQVMQVSLEWDSLARQVGISNERIAEIKKRFIKL